MERTQSVEITQGHYYYGTLLRFLLLQIVYFSPMVRQTNVNDSEYRQPLVSRNE